jgi:hypothetical protein
VFRFALLLLVSWTAVSAKKGELFEEFLADFMQEQDFQKERIRFPIYSVTLTPTMGKDKLDSVRIDSDAWKFNDFLLLRRGMQIHFYDNFQRKPNDSDERVLSVTGYENGLSYSYYFRRRDGKWFLVRILDESD